MTSGPALNVCPSMAKTSSRDIPSSLAAASWLISPRIARQDRRSFPHAARAWARFDPGKDVDGALRTKFPTQRFEHSPRRGQDHFPTLQAVPLAPIPFGLVNLGPAPGDFQRFNGRAGLLAVCFQQLRVGLAGNGF